MAEYIDINNSVQPDNFTHEKRPEIVHQLEAPFDANQSIEERLKTRYPDLDITIPENLNQRAFEDSKGTEMEQDMIRRGEIEDLNRALRRTEYTNNPPDDGDNFAKKPEEKHSSMHDALNDPDLFRNNLKGDYIYSEETHGKSASGQLELPDETIRNSKAQLAAGGKERKVADDGGHLIGTRFGGSPYAENLDAQNKDVNRRGFKGTENEWANNINEGNKVYVSVENYKSNNSERPDATIGYNITEDADGNRTWDAFSYQNASYTEQANWENSVNSIDRDDTYYNPMQDADNFDAEVYNKAMSEDIRPSKKSKPEASEHLQENADFDNDLNRDDLEENANDETKKGDNTDNDTREDLNENHPESTEPMSEENIEQNPVETEKHSTDSQIEDEFESTEPPKGNEQREDGKKEVDQEIVTDESEEDNQPVNNEQPDDSPMEDEPKILELSEDNNLPDDILIEEKPECMSSEDRNQMQVDSVNEALAEEADPIAENCEQPAAIEPDIEPDPILYMPVDDVPVEID